MAIKNAKAKGNQREHKCMKSLEDVGYSCVRAAASLGVFDVIASNRLGTRYIQVKSNCWPCPAERRAMAHALRKLPPGSTAECWRYDDYARAPRIKHVDEFGGIYDE